MNRFALCCCLLCLSATAAASGAGCALQVPPADAGAYVTPGGFLLVHPRSAAMGRGYTGCRTIWVVQSDDDMPLLMRVHFRAGRPVAVDGYDGRGGQTVRRCDLPSSQPACAGLDDHPLLAPDLPTWPRVCVDRPELPACRAAPQ
ncbi:hypothetical protein [Methyloversatilis thermotolerans]|uniref:hypothetical protein n=1 Tax=Methyloversatilis thermotolerans TaxID=1346290 RepID=UPI00036D2999|nr:hypothetical protein [Methyloversatilis thermotolerans]